MADAKLNMVLYLARWATHPGEPWTVRKALRRLLAYAREHTDQIGQTLAAWRGHLERGDEQPLHP